MADAKTAVDSIVDAVIDNADNERDITTKQTQAPRPFVVWVVDSTEHRLKLTTAWIQRLEQQFGKSLMLAVTEDGIPATSVILPILQAALQKYNHGMKSNTVENMLDRYIDGGKTIYDLLTEVLYPLMYDAGFFTKAMLEAMTADMAEMDQMM